MFYSKRLLTIFLTCMPLALIAAETGFSSLEERMTGQEFNESGLYKLTPEELAALNRWILERSLAPHEIDRELAAVESEDRRGLRDDHSRRDGPIRSRITGSFTGWSGDTEFELENGMVWRQADANNRFSIPEIMDPEVEIRPAFLSSWQMQVKGYGRRVRVERVK